VEELTAKASRVKEKKAKNRRTSLKVEAAAEVEDAVVSAEVEEEDASVDITGVVEGVEELAQSHKAKVVVTLMVLAHREMTKVRAKGSPTRPVTLNVVAEVVAEEVVVADEEEDSLVDSTVEVVTAVVVDEPQVAEVIKREEIATQRTRVQMKVLHKKQQKNHHHLFLTYL